MYAETKKLHLIEELIKVDSDLILAEIEHVLSKSKAAPPKSNGFNGFKSSLTLEEVNEMECNIEGACGINQTNS